jgi:hypothetical protein
MSRYRVRSEQTWAAAKDDYLAGDTAEMVCRRYALQVDTLRKRAAREGWRRADQSDPEPESDHPADDWTDGLTDAQRVATAKRLADWALAQGDLPRARGWLRLAAEYRRFAAAEPEQAPIAVQADAGAPSEAAQFHSFHPVFSSPEPPSPNRLRESLLKAEIDKAARLRDMPRLRRAQARLEALQQAP